LLGKKKSGTSANPYGEKWEESRESTGTPGMEKNEPKNHQGSFGEGKSRTDRPPGVGEKGQRGVKNVPLERAEAVKRNEAEGKPNENGAVQDTREENKSLDIKRGLA